MNCKYCQSENVIKYGKYKDVQRYFCKDCKRKFAGIDTIPKMQYPTSQISDVLNMYYEGMSLHEIRRNLIQQHNSYISDVTALNWVRRFSKPIIMEANKYKPDVGGVWVADETMIELDGKNIWLWDIINTKTRFLIASHMSYSRGLPPKKESSCNVRLELKIKGVNHGQEIAFSRGDYQQVARS